MIERDDPVDGLVSADDSRVTAFRRWLYVADQWRSAKTERNEQESAYDEAGALVGTVPGPGDRNTVPGSRWPANGDRMGDDRRKPRMASERCQRAPDAHGPETGLVDFWASFLGPGRHLLAGDFAVRAEGSPSLIDDKIPRCTGTAEQPCPWTPP